MSHARRSASALPDLPLPEPIARLLGHVDAMAAALHRFNEQSADATRASIMRFVRGDQSLRLDMADKLAAYFGLVLTHLNKKPKG